MFAGRQEAEISSRASTAFRRTLAGACEMAANGALARPDLGLMRVTSESFTVVPYPRPGEISVLIAGLNIVLDLEEARELTRQLRTGMQVADPAHDHITGPLERTAPTAKKAAASQR